MTPRKPLSPSDKRSLAIGGFFVVIVLTFFGWQMRENRLHDQIVDPSTPQAPVHGH